MIYKFTKRIFDFVCAFLGIVGTSPIWILSIILTELSDPGKCLALVLLLQLRHFVSYQHQD